MTTNDTAALTTDRCVICDVAAWVTHLNRIPIKGTGPLILCDFCREKVEAAFANKEPAE